MLLCAETFQTVVPLPDPLCARGLTACSSHADGEAIRGVLTCLVTKDEVRLWGKRV